MMQTTTNSVLTPTQMHLLKLFSFNSSEDYAREVEGVLTTHFLLKDTADCLSNWEFAIDDHSLFTFYLDLWRKQTKFLSSVNQIKQNQAFRKIVDMGGNAVPYILKEIEREPSQLVWALNEIFHKKTGEKNSITEACKLWIKELKKQ